MLLEYKTIKKEASMELAEKKSKFIGYAKPAANEEEAVDFINSIRKKHRDATHNVYAYIIKENNIQRYSDDGEPKGTAGIPVLDIMKKTGITDAAIVVTRYFGGTLLGAGGLVRAYSAAAALAVKEATVITKKLCGFFEICIEYTLADIIQNELSKKNITIVNTEFFENVKITVSVLEENSQELIENITEISRGKAKITKIKSEFGEI